MIRLVLILAWLICVPSVVVAQALVQEYLNKAKLTWEWAQGTGGAVAEFRVKCGINSGSYTKTTALTDPAARMLAIKQAITGAGKWFCVVTAANSFGESPPTNEVSFDAGAVPAGPANLSLQAM